jgi:hypothetical protein
MHTEFLWRNPEENDHLEDWEDDGKINIKLAITDAVCENEA